MFIVVLFLKDSLQIYSQHVITSLVTITMYSVRLDLLHVLREITLKKKMICTHVSGRMNIHVCSLVCEAVDTFPSAAALGLHNAPCARGALGKMNTF